MTTSSARDAYLKRTYGITQAQYDAILKVQGGVCAVCDEPPRPGKVLVVDHSHRSGVIRGLLHAYCNRFTVGRNNDTWLMLNSAAYLGQSNRVAQLRLTVPKRK